MGSQFYEAQFLSLDEVDQIITFRLRQIEEEIVSLDSRIVEFEAIVDNSEVDRYASLKADAIARLNAVMRMRSFFLESA